MYREYNTNLIEMRGPHVLSPLGIGRRMLAVMFALVPTLVVGATVYGGAAIAITIACMFTCLVFEVLLNLCLKRRPLADDGTCLVTGMIIAFNLPSNVPFWIIIVACAIAIIVVKGPVGDKRNVINPAATAVCFVFFCLKDYLDLWPVPLIGSPDIPEAAQTAASGLQVMGGASGTMSTNWELFLGFSPGAFGSVSAIAIMLGAAYLIWRRLINFLIPVSILATCAIISLAVGVSPLSTICSGGLMLGACFMATDPVTSPKRYRAMAVYGIGIAIITMAIRIFVPFIDEGVYLGIIIMNLTSPHLDRFFVMEKYKSAHNLNPNKKEIVEEEDVNNI